MPRFATKITKEELEAKINAVYNGDRYHYKRLTPKVEKDLSKVQFDCENVATKPGEFAMGADDKVMGYQTLDNGLTFCGFLAAGDWETPVFFCLYYSGTELRGYIPKKGNSWNFKTKMAYGNEDEDAIENEELRDVEEGPNIDQDAIIEDIKERIQVK